MAQTQQEDRLNLGAKKFIMWIFIFTSFMLFAALTSGFIVYSGGSGHGLNITLPSSFRYSTIVLVLSSITLFLAARAAKRLDYDKQQRFLWVTISLGVAFLILQVYGWYTLSYKMHIYLVDPNATRSFVYVMTFLHLLHIIGGIIWLISALSGSIKRIPQVKNLYRMEMTSIFWHFLDIIWIYLYVFLLLNQ
ncbi:MAG: heme-copper oxidase subunit [Mucilaginibacter sp.]|uniref:cytochrome c oxidase subunit 3 n=1 Tax=Mucilaginibacter sp. TaxID=1882438 RepID=UPI002605B77A|nr:cytochrome c oxidase subunit 3 [Mucilaginibacter sp.]MDB5003814.1 heme-copper oxidase subunit [Mucilaginibacter sp.]